MPMKKEEEKMSENPVAEPGEQVITRGQSLGITASSIIGAAAVFVVTIIVSRVLTEAAYSQFLLFWSLMFGVFGAILGIQQEVTRATGARAESSAVVATKLPQTVRVLPVAAFLGGCIAVLLVGTSFLWGEKVLGKDFFASVLVIGVGAVLYACHVAVVGTAAGTKNWSVFAWLGGTESVLRLVLTGAVALFAGTLWGFQFAAIAPVTLWIFLLAFFPHYRPILGGARIHDSFSGASQKMAWAILTSTAYAIMVTGFPVLLKWTTGHIESAEEIALLAATITAISLTRAPIMIPLQMFQGVAISAFLKQQHRPLAALMKPAGVLLGIGVIGAIAAYLVGPFLFSLLYPKQGGILTGFELGALTFASAFMAVVVLTGTATLASNHHKLYFAGWGATAIVAIAMLFTPFSIIDRSIVALLAGPLAGIIIHTAGLAIAPARPLSKESL